MAALADGETRGATARVDGRVERAIALRRGATTALFLDRCPHARWPLATFDGRFLSTPDGLLICAAHGAVFDPLTGACRGGPGTGAGLTPLPLDSLLAFDDP